MFSPRHKLILVSLAAAGFLAFSMLQCGMRLRRSQTELALIRAVRRNDPRAVEALLRGGANPNTTRPIPYWTPMNWRDWQWYVGTTESHGLDPTPVLVDAVWRPEAATMVRSLLAAGADPNARGTYRVTALHYAAMTGHLGIVDALLKHRADPNVKDVRGNTPLMMASWGGWGGPPGRRRRPGAGRHMEVIDRLLHSNADVNATANGGESALSNAAWNGNAPVVYRLLAYGAKATAGLPKRSVLLDAVTGMIYRRRFPQSDYTQVIRSLIAQGAELSFRDSKGRTALGYAKSGRLPEIAAMLEKAGGKL